MIFVNSIKHRLLSVALSVPMLCNVYATTNLNAFAEETEPSTTVIEEATTDTTSTVENTETTAVSTVGSTKSTTSETTTTEPKKIDPTGWDHKSNFPDENGELRFWMDDLEEGRKGSLKLTYTTEDTNKPISGSKVQIYTIATLSVHKGDAKYELVDAVKNAYPDLNLAGMTTDEINALAENMVNLNLTAAAEATTDDNGVAKFENIEPGMYLVREFAKIGMAKDYEEFSPFFIQIPYPQTEDTVYTGQWLYDVESLPKTELKGKKKLLIIPPTGDETNTNVLIGYSVVFGLSAASVLTAVVVIAKRKKNNKN